MAYNMGDAVGYIRLNTQDFDSNYENVHQKTELLDKAADGMAVIYNAAGKVIADAFEKIAQAAAGALKSVVQVGSSYQAAMSQVAATMGMTAEEIRGNSEEYEKLSAAAKEMGATTKFSATQAAEALNYMALAGYSVDESISVLPKVLNVAAAGGMDLAKASDMVTDALSALGLPLEEAESFVDKLAKTSQKSNTSVEQLGDAILQIGGTAKLLSGGVDELNTALGILANNGIKGAEGGTALRQVILNLTAPTEKSAKLMAELGFSAYDAAGNIKPLNQVFAELDEILDGVSDERRMEILSGIFDARQLKSANALLANYGESWDELAEQIGNAEGAAARMAETMQENFIGAVTIAKSAIEGVQVTAFEALEIGLTRSVKSATSAIDELNKTLQTPEMQAALQKIGEMLGDILEKFVKFVANTAIPKMIEWFSRLDEVADKLKIALIALGAALPIVAAGLLTNEAAVKALTASQIALKIETLAANAALLANPYTLVAAAVAVLVAGFVSFIKQQKDAYDAIVNTNNEFSKQADIARENAQALQEYRDSANAIVNDVTVQINEVRTLCNELGEYANKTHLTSEELSAAQAIIDRLNELYPENTAYIKDGQVVAYGELTQALNDYTEKLYYAKKLEAEQNKYFEAKDLLEETKENLKKQQEMFQEANDEYIKWKQKWDKYQIGVNNYSVIDEQEAYKLGFKSVGAYLKAQYDAATQNLDNITSAIGQSNTIIIECEKDIQEAEHDMLEYRLKSGEKVEGIYLSEAEAIRDIKRKEAEEYAARERELHKDEIEAAEKAAKEKEKAYEKMWEDLDKLDKDWQLRKISSEEEYQSRRKEILEDNRNENDDKWVKEYNKSLVYAENQQKKHEQEKTRIDKEEAEKREKQRKEEIQKQFDDLEYRNETDEKYTKEMMYNDMETIISGLDKTSDLYKQFNDQIVKGRRQMNIDLQKENKKTAESDFTTWTKSYDGLVKEAEKVYSDIQSNQEKLTQTLIGSIKLYDTESKKVWDKQKKRYKEEETMKVSAKNLKEQIKATEEYQKKLDKLIDSGLSQNVLNEIFSMSEDEQKKYVESLSKLSQAELKDYSDSYDKLYENTKEYTAKIYDEQLKQFEQDYKGKFDAIFEQMPQNLELVGSDTIEGFLKGIEEKSGDTEGAMKSIMDGVLEKAKEALDIHSPSGKFEEIGVNSVLGFINGLGSKFDEIYEKFRNLGETVGTNFTEGFKTVWGTFKQTLQSEMSDLGNLGKFSQDISTSFKTPPVFNSSQWGNPSNPELAALITQLANTQAVQQPQLTKADLVDAIKQSLPSGNVYLQLNGRTLAIATRQELNGLASESGNLNIKT